jgi:folate-binding protein YgfZ
MNGMLTNDVAKLAPGSGCHAAMLTVKGKLLGDVRIYVDTDAILLALAADLREKIHGALERHLIVDEVEIEDLTTTTTEIGVYGPDARAAVEAVSGALPDLPLYGHVRRGELLILAANDFGVDGYRIIGGPSLRAAFPGPWLGDDELEVMRVEAGRPLYGVDMGEEQLPMEALLDDAISHTKGCYMGQEVIARATARGHINRRLVGLVVEGEGTLPRGARLKSAAREDAGYVTSSVISPRLGVIALGYLHRTTWDIGTEVEVLLDGVPARRARVSALPFGAGA